MSELTEVSLSKAVDYYQEPVLSGKYEHKQVPLAENQVNINISAGQTMTFLLPGNQVYNLEKSYIEMQLTVDPQGANRFIWMMAGAIPFWRTLSIQPESGNSLYIDMLHHFSKLSLPYLTPYSKFVELDNSNIFFPSRVLPNANLLPASGNPAAIPYTDIQSAINLDNNSSNVAVGYVIRIPFHLFPGTFLSTKQDLKTGMDVQIQFTLEDPNRWLWSSLSSTNPASTPLALTVTTNLRFNSVYLQLAVQQDADVRKYVESTYLKGYKMFIPSVSKVMQVSLSGTAQSLTSPSISSAYGRKLQRIFTGCFNGTENINTSLDNANNPTVPFANASTNRILTYQTQWDNVNLQQKYIYASPFQQSATAATVATLPALATTGIPDDWSRYYKYFEGSVYQSSFMLGQNYVVIDDFTEPETRTKKNLENEDRLSGTDISIGNHTWIMNNTTSSATYNWYVFIQTWKLLTVAPGVMSISS